MSDHRGRGASDLGASAIEYALMVGLIAVVIMGAVASLGSALFGEEVEVLGRVLEQGDLEQGDLEQGDLHQDQVQQRDCALPDPARGRSTVKGCG